MPSKFWFTVTLLFAPGMAVAAKGMVTHDPQGCSHFLVETAMGYALLDRYGGNDPSKGDTIVGEFETYGMKNIFNITADEELTVWVEDFLMARERAIEKLYEKCS